MPGFLDKPMDAAARRLVHLLGRDVTRATAHRSCLVLAPHQDDETLGCGALLCRKAAAGSLTRVLFASDGRYSHRSPRVGADELARMRKAEAAEACRRLGVAPEDTLFLDLEETCLWQRLDAVREGVREAYRARPVDEVYMPSIHDGHPDHRALARAAIDLACAGEIEAPLYEYPVWAFHGGWWRQWLGRSLRLLRASWSRRSTGSVEVRPLLVSTDGYLERKRRALEAHATQMTRITGDADWLTLEDVDGGRFLAGFFGRHEPFFRFHTGIDRPPVEPG